MIEELHRLIQIVRKLRAPDGCDWDNVQTSKSLIPYLLEETYEVIEAIEHTQHPWCFGIQWHPEFLITDADTAIVKDFIKHA